MELKCPQCGKWMAVSQEELVIHDCQVVCPQCLAVCQYEGGALVVRDDSDAPYRHNVVVEETKNDTARFCHGCGKQLPAGISFCPYCGADLNAPFDTPQPEPVVSVPETESVREPAPQSRVSAPEEVKKPAAQQEQPASPRVGNQLRNMPHHYNAVHPRLHQNGTMPGTGFKIFAYTAIVLLLALLVYIIFAGIAIEPQVQ